MTPEQEAHLESINNAITKRISAKYRRGQAEHGGDLWARPALRDMVDEITDLNAYFITMEQQFQQMHQLLQQAREHVTNCEWAPALAALDVLDAGFRSQLPPSGS